MTTDKLIGKLVSDGPRAEVWRHIFGREEVPLKSLKVRPLLIGSVLFAAFDIDIAALDEPTIERAVAYLSKQSGIAAAEVDAGVRGEHGIPILANDVVVQLPEDAAARIAALEAINGGGMPEHVHLVCDDCGADTCCGEECLDHCFFVSEDDDVDDGEEDD